MKLVGAIVLVIALLCGGVAQAGELRIFDLQGLVRIVRETNGRAPGVLVHLNAPLGDSQLVLSNVNGLANDIPGVPVDEHTIRFSPVPEGSWRLKGSAQVTAVKGVEIEEKGSGKP